MKKSENESAEGLWEGDRENKTKVSAGGWKKHFKKERKGMGICGTDYRQILGTLDHRPLELS